MSIAKFEKVSFEEWVKACKRDFWNEGDQEMIDSYNAIKLPTRATKGSAGYDFYLPYEMTLTPEKEKSDILKQWEKWSIPLCPTGIRCQIEEGYFLQLVPKSGLGTKYGFSFVNTMGIIDSDYYHSDNEGHIHFCAKVSQELTLNAGDKMFQGIFLPYYLAEEEEVLNQRNGGHGSTGA